MNFHKTKSTYGENGNLGAIVMHFAEYEFLEKNYHDIELFHNPIFPHYVDRIMIYTVKTAHVSLHKKAGTFNCVPHVYRSNMRLKCCACDRG